MWRAFERLTTSWSSPGRPWEDAMVLVGSDAVGAVGVAGAPAELPVAPHGAPVPARAAVSTSELAPSLPDTGDPARRRLVVWVVAGPLQDLGAARMVSDALARVDGVDSISVSGDREHHVQFEGWFRHERELVTELERVLPFAFEVESVSGVELGLRLRAG
jgi:hypothetical protein